MKGSEWRGVIHFVGIGGIGMSGIADVLCTLGYRVQGSDQAENAQVKRLRSKGVKVFIGHREDNIQKAEVVVVSSAIKKDNVEVQAARAARIPVIRRAEMLAELMRFKHSVVIGGSHGKTTTTSLVASVLSVASYDPTVVNGGVIDQWGSNARVGASDWIVVEGDESDGTFTRLPSRVSVVTNIDPEHIDHYGSLAALEEAFLVFASNVPFYGFCVLCIDHPRVHRLVASLWDRRVITCGLSSSADVRGVNLRYRGMKTLFDVEFSGLLSGYGRLSDVEVPLVGEHNVKNTLAALSVGVGLGIAGVDMKRALSSAPRVRRRFYSVGVSPRGATIIDDYAHHPAEIRAVLAAARASFPQGRCLVIFQPHRYSRLQALFDDFCYALSDADVVIVAPVYAAGEQPIDGIDRDHIIARLRAHGHSEVVALQGEDQLAELIHTHGNKGDVILCLGAGSIGQWVQNLQGLAEAQVS
ncbi:MAG: UDP-N-acetylmuramate--L-alanine ligase [Alphaproteobacteria bacterium GM202ARS2]|nr:UDP-N-acetylmuramate--L-alanine ligase [Alphaproteobacteria bacterium GM202ARS2]